MKISVLQHVSYEKPGLILDWAESRDVELKIHEVFRGDELPGMADFDLLVIMGGPMSVREEEKYPWLTAEKELIAAAIKGKKKVLGICLGGQLVAEAIGGRVSIAPEKEIGWHPVTLTPKAATSSIFKTLPEKITPFHWHEEMFSMPEKAFRIAGSAACPNQAFEYDKRVVGMQFHLEMTPKIVQDLIDVNLTPEDKGRFVQDGETMLKQKFRFEANREYLYSILDNLAFKKYTITMKKKRG